MPQVKADMSISLDGFITGPNDSVESPGVTHLKFRVLR